VPFADVVIRVPVTPVLLAPLVTTVPLQVFACELAWAKGLEKRGFVLVPLSAIVTPTK